jgi:hypothetical protein
VQVLQWIQQPTDINSLRDFAEWKEKCDVKVRDRGKIPPFKDDKIQRRLSYIALFIRASLTVPCPTLVL